MKKLLLLFLLFVLTSVSVIGQTISVITNDRNPFVHAFSIQGLLPLTANHETKITDKLGQPYYDIITIFGDGQYAIDSIFSGPLKEGQYHFSSPINYTSHLYPSSSNYPIIIILKPKQSSQKQEILIQDLTIPNQDLIQDHGMCQTEQGSHLEFNKKIQLQTLKNGTKTDEYLVVISSFLSHTKHSKIQLIYDTQSSQFIGQSIPNAVGAIRTNEDVTIEGKLEYLIDYIPRSSQYEPQELHIIQVFKRVNNRQDSSIFIVKYFDENNDILDSDSISPLQTNITNANLSKQIDQVTLTKSPRRKRFSDMSLLELLANNWSVILVGLLVILLLIYLIKRYKPF